MLISKDEIKEIVESYIQMTITKKRDIDVTDPIYSLSPAYFDFRTFSRSLDSKMGGYIEKIAFDLAKRSEYNTSVAQSIGKEKVDLYIVRDFHYVCEAKTGGNLDNKKAREERDELLRRKEILKEQGIPEDKIKIRLLVPLVAEVLDKMFNTFEKDEIIAGNAVWEFVMGYADDKDYVSKCIHEAMNNLTTKLNSEIMCMLNRRLKEITGHTKIQYTRQLLMFLNEHMSGDMNMKILTDEKVRTNVAIELDKQLNNTQL
jgi:hypothetical protein